MNDNGLAAAANTAYQQSQRNQQQLDQNVGNATNQYNQSVTGANNAQSDLSNFTKNMTSGTDMYAQQLQRANQNAGYNVNDLNNAQGQVSQIQGILGGLPRAVQAQNANYGATAGDVAGQYATEAGNLNQSLNLANTNAQNQILKMQGGLTGAQAGTTAGIQTQDQQRQSYASTAANAVNIMHESQSTMSNMIAAQQSQGRLTAEQQQIFSQAKMQNAQAQAAYAAATASLAAANQANAQARQINFTTDTTQAQNAATAAQQATARNQILGDAARPNVNSFTPTQNPTQNNQGIGGWLNGLGSSFGQWLPHF